MSFIISINTAYAFFAPEFSDCLEEGSDQYDQVEACQILIETNSKRRDLYIVLANTLEKRNKHQQSQKIYRKALQVFPGDSYFLEKLSIAKGKPAKKIEKKAEKIIPEKTVEQDIVKQTQTHKKTRQQQSTQLQPAKLQPSVVVKNVTQAKKQQTSLANTNQQQQKLDPLQRQLILLKSLKKQELISQAEYDNRKKTLLDTNFRIAKKYDTNSIGTVNTGVIKNKKALNKSDNFFKDIDFGNYHALIIGNNKYKHLPKLKTAVNDAQSLASLLKEKYGFKISLLINADRYKTLKVLGGLRNTLTKNDNLLIYYAGHGVLDEASERGYWLPIDAERDFTSNWISTAEITDALRALQSWHVLVVADSCYSGTLVRSAPITFKNPEEKQKLLKRLNKKKSRTAITSGGLEPVADSGGDNHSVFAQAFLEILNDNDNVIEAEYIFARLRDKVILNADQTPEYSNIRKVGHNGGDFIFHRK